MDDRSSGQTGWPVRSVGPVLHMRGFGPPPTAGWPVVGVPLAPHQGFSLGISVRLARHGCYIRGSWTQLTVLWVKERFLVFTRWVSIPLDVPFVLHAPAMPGSPYPRQDLVCP